jgi:hypothetical protein
MGNCGSDAAMACWIAREISARDPVPRTTHFGSNQMCTIRNPLLPN